MFQGCRQFHTSAKREDEFDPEKRYDPIFKDVPKDWMEYNKIKYDPQKPGDPRRPAVSTCI